MRQNLLPCSLAILIGASASIWSGGEGERARPEVAAPELRTVVVDLEAVFDAFPRRPEMEAELGQLREQLSADLEARFNEVKADYENLRNNEMELLEPGSEEFQVKRFQLQGMADWLNNEPRGRAQVLREQLGLAKNDRVLEIQQEIEKGLQVFAEQAAKAGEPIGLILRMRRSKADDNAGFKLAQREQADVLFADARYDVTQRVIQFFQTWGPAQPRNK